MDDQQPPAPLIHPACMLAAVVIVGAALYSNFGCQKVGSASGEPSPAVGQSNPGYTPPGSDASNNPPKVEEPANLRESAKYDLSVSDVKWQHEDYVRYAAGTVTNNSEHVYAYAEVQINLFDKEHNVVASTMANVNNLGPHEKWKFRAPVLESKARTFEIKDVTGY